MISRRAFFSFLTGGAALLAGPLFAESPGEGIMVMNYPLETELYFLKLDGAKWRRIENVSVMDTPFDSDVVSDDGLWAAA